MPSGSCYCGKVTVEYPGQYATTAICHCSNCRHYTGSMFSNNYVVANEGFKVSGGPLKEITKIAASGNTITNCFCGDCGTTMYRYGDGFGGPHGMKIIQAGILDHAHDLDGHKPELEMFVTERVKWISEFEGLRQYAAMPTPKPST